MLIYIIVFKEDNERRHLLRKRFGEIGLEPIFIDAIKGSDLATDDQKKFQGISRQIWAKEAFHSNAIGCALSHFHAWNNFLEAGANGAFVFEDDARPIKSQKARIKSQLARVWANAAEFDIVFLANRLIQSKSTIIADSSQNLCCLKYSGVGAESYFITRPAAERLLRNPLRWALEVDTLLHHWWLNDSKVLYLVQPLFEEDGRQTLIGYEEARKANGSSLLFALLRRINRLRWSIYKRLKFPFYMKSINRLVI